MIKNKFAILVYILFFLNIFFACSVKTPNAETTQKNNEQKSEENQKTDKKSSQIRPAAVAGSFYPDNPQELTNMINNFFTHVPNNVLSITPKILVSPHAGYIYSGPIASYGYKAIQGLPKKTIILLGPAHTEAFMGASIYSSGSFTTPLGSIKIDSDLSSRILKENTIFTDRISPHIKEHSLETQLPFLQLVLKDFKIVPIVIGEINNLQEFQIMSQAIDKHIKGRDDVLIIASTDLSHYNSYEIAQKMDSIAIDGILRLDTDFLLMKAWSRDCELCGLNPVILALMLAKLEENNKAELLFKANSGDTAGDKNRVVGYASILIGKAKGEMKMSELSQEEKKELLKIARDTIFSYIKTKQIPKFKNITNPKFLRKQGAFVTIKINHDLRGCIGTFTSDQPLYNTIIEMAVSASTRDPRFPPISALELKDISLEISVLSELNRIKNIDEIKVGTHGIYIMRGYYRGVLLPQVATEYKWDRNTFLQQTCYKAGLPADAWKDPATEIYIFSAQVFGEE
ncbi:MAG: AmmeMemoRadiSam system protein B [Candidatus Firestonebacteria bacterium]|nr:AmmeMemoRadiSam system protein B [Candidatus Firestonebacteria bacterium]